MRRLYITSVLVLAGCASDPETSTPKVTVDTNLPSPPPPSEKRDETSPGINLPDQSPALPPPGANVDRMCPAAHPDTFAALALMWSPDAGPRTGSVVESRGVVRANGCMVRLGIAKSSVSASDRWTIFLEKRDLTDDEATCPEPKGYRALAESFVEPHALVASHFVDPRLFTVAFDVKPTADAAVEMRMAQYDWATGDVLRRAVMAVEGYPPNVPPAGAPFSLNVNGCDLVLYGDGEFPGATGTNIGVWQASFPAFLAGEPQLPRFAARATYQ